MSDMKKILVVDDYEYNVKLVHMALGSSGYEITEAYDGREGVKRAKEFIPDLVLMDIQMPVMDGIEAMKMIKEMPELSKAKIVAYTAYAMSGDSDKLLAEGFDDYLAKPVTVANLLTLAKKHLGS